MPQNVDKCKFTCTELTMIINRSVIAINWPQDALVLQKKKNLNAYN